MERWRWTDASIMWRIACSTSSRLTVGRVAFYLSGNADEDY